MASTYTPIATTTLGSNTGTVTFNSISGSYTDLILVTSARGTDNTDGLDIKGTFNSDTGSNYSWTQLYGDGSSAASNRGSNQTYMKMGMISGALTAANTFSANVTHIQNYSNTTTYKSSITRRQSPTVYVVAGVNMWRSTSAVTSITLTAEAGSFVTGSTFTLYGIKAA